MFRLIKQVFFILLSFSRLLTTKCVSLNNEPCMIRPILIDVNPVEFNCYPFMISLDKCNRSCNTIDDLSTKICIPIKKKDRKMKIKMKLKIDKTCFM